MASWQDVADVVFALLGEDAGRTAEEIASALAAAGEGWPVDSLLLVEILQRVEQRFAVRVPETVEAARSFNSVRAFSEMVAAAVAAAGQAASGDGAA
jgi:acyl carrier protein